jgi:putative ABC transport system ATP-binding protein
MAADALVEITGVNHFYGEGALRRQILFDISTEIRSGETVILTGPSGSGKTTLLTLIGGLRSTQVGSLKVLGHELNGAGEGDLVTVRKDIGYIFQAHNLLASLTAQQNVQMALSLHPEVGAKEAAARCRDALAAVGLADCLRAYPDELSGGQKQRVAIARALVGRPKIILADEPTASLDKKSGHDVAELLRDLAKHQGCAVLLVTHDNRILDIADRIMNLDDGRLSSFTDAVLSNTRQMFAMLAEHNRKGELTRQLAELPTDRFVDLLEHVTAQFAQFLHLVELSHNEAFESMLEQVLDAFTLKVGDILHADRATLLLVDRERAELWSKLAQSDGSKPLEIRMPMAAGIAGKVVSTGKAVNIADVYTEPLFNREVDQRTGYRTRSMLCMPLIDHNQRTFAVAQLLNKNGGEPFDADDEQRFHELAASIGVILESWWRMSARSKGGLTTV